jgi:amidase
MPDDISLAQSNEEPTIDRRTLLTIGGGAAAAAVIGIGAAGIFGRDSNAVQPGDGTGGGLPTESAATPPAATPTESQALPTATPAADDGTIGFVDEEQDEAATEAPETETAETEQPESTPQVRTAGAVDPATVIEEVTIRQLREYLDSGAFTVTELVQASLDRIAGFDPRDGEVGLQAVITTNPDALDVAASLDEELAAGQSRGLMHGIPVLLKDIVATGDQMPNTAGAIAMRDQIAVRDSFLAARFREAGAVILGKTNLTEWSNYMGADALSGFSTLGRLTVNPYNLNMSASGSSTGSAVAVAASYVPVAVGAEYNGSIICPASLCGVVGVKPTVGLTSRAGVIPIAFTRDSIGPMARTVEDAAIALGVMAGLDPEDPSRTVGVETSVHAMFDTEMVPEPGTADYTTALDPDALNGARLGIYLAGLNLDEGSQALFDAVVPVIEEAGAELVDVPGFPGYGDVWGTGLIGVTEFAWGLQHYLDEYTPDGPMQTIQDIVDFNLANPDEALEGQDQSGLTDLLTATSLDDQEYIDATVNLATAMRTNGIDAVMDDLELDAIICPTATIARGAFDHTGFGSTSDPTSVAGYPSISLPIGLWDGLPGGLHIFGRAFSEDVLLGIAYAIEQKIEGRTPPTYIPREE